MKSSRETELSENTLLQIFAKYPVPGNVKTRLHSILTAKEAAVFHANLVQTSIKKLSYLPQQIKLELWGDAPSEQSFYRRLLGQTPRMRFRLQKGNDLGARMAFAMKSGLENYKKVILIGTDCPILSCRHILQVEEQLVKNQFNLIAAEDGGYVLIASMSYHPAVFSGINWGTSQVMKQTLEAAAKIGWGVKVHGCLWDIDNAEDYARFTG